MNKKLKLLALLLVTMLVLCACEAEDENEAAEPTPTPEIVETVETEETAEAAETEEAEEAEEPAADEPEVLMTVGGVPVLKGDVVYYSDLTMMYYQYGMMEYYFNYLDSLQYLIYNDVAAKLLALDKAEELLGEEYDSLVEQYGIEFDGYVEQQIEAIKSEEGYAGTDDEAYESALKYFASVGYTRDSFVQERIAHDAMVIYFSQIETDVSEEEVEQVFDSYVEYDKDYYGNDIGMYEYATQYMGEEVYYTPEGYRGILHILLEADEELVNAYKNAADAESKQAAADAVIASLKDTIDEIYEKYEAGTPFEELIAQYNIDPGMTDEATLKTGYLVHKDSQLFVPEFTAGAFTEEMAKPGDVSKPVVTSFGVHILYYLNDVPSGAAELTDEIRQAIRQDLEDEQRFNIIVDRLKQFEIVYYPAYDELIGTKNFLDD